MRTCPPAVTAATVANLQLHVHQYKGTARNVTAAGQFETETCTTNSNIYSSGKIINVDQLQSESQSTFAWEYAWSTAEFHFLGLLSQP